MPRGAPDYSNVRAYEPLHRLDDHAELAARLGSVVTFDRGGNVIYLDTFSQGSPQWGLMPYGSGAELKVATEHASSPPFSLRMRTGQDGAHAAKATIQVPYHHHCRMGLEYAFTHTIDSTDHFFDFLHWDGEWKYSYGVVFKIQTGELKVRDKELGWWVFADGLHLKSDAFLFNRAKLVIDTKNNKYVRFTFNDETWLLNEYEPPLTEITSIPYLEPSVQFTGDEGHNRDHYIDDVIVTQNEP